MILGYNFMKFQYERIKMNALVQVKVDKKLKEQAEELLNEFGLDITTALRMFLKAVVREQKIPFKLKKQDPFYSKENLKHLKESIKELDEGKGIIMTYEQFEQFANAMEKATPEEAKVIGEKVMKGEYFGT